MMVGVLPRGIKRESEVVYGRQESVLYDCIVVL